MVDGPEDLRAALDSRTLQLSIVLDALGERDRRDAEQNEWGFALQLQTGSLPTEYPPFPDRPQFDVRGGMVTAFQVGGDVYDYAFLGDRHLALLVADASGKGLPAAVTITRMRTLLRAASRRLGDPGQCLALVNELLCLDNPALMFVTAFYGVLDTQTGVVAYANAGHNPPLLARAGSVRAVGDEPALVLGVMEGAEYATATLQLHPGDTLCCFSDGVTEAQDPAEALFGEDRLAAALASHAAAPLPEVEAGILAAVDGFIGTAAVADDLTLLLLRWNGLRAS